METEVSFSCLQQPDAEPYADPEESTCNLMFMNPCII